ncbi:hypothetical protein DQ04_14381000 [Trypanosoma grayi]|uniref:hypothetical protein n=1 Tax=Trypanosoma grayi TaxID=71804 RepID=UPI0004F42841|nr:hypothetical protein DQ04_14381000 [Trypanosoma grayi]KEG06365.1 hypothetical protein DQ04_14381000 [Trypanosoma grayi]
MRSRTGIVSVQTSPMILPGNCHNTVPGSAAKRSHATERRRGGSRAAASAASPLLLSLLLLLSASASSTRLSGGSSVELSVGSGAKSNSPCTVPRKNGE